MIRSATISPCGLYRYGLIRRWGDGPSMGFMMLNPSTADGEADDPTIRRCIGFARREGCGGLIVVNLFPLRATDPAKLWATPYAGRFGLDSDSELQRHLKMVDGPLVAGWGADAHAQGGDVLADTVYYLGHRMMCLGKTKSGAPRHPLYVKGDAPLVSLIAAQKGQGRE